MNPPDVEPYRLPDEAIDSIWTQALENFRSGSNEIVLSVDTQDTIGKTGISEIADRYSALINVRVSVLHDSTANVIRILPPPGFVGFIGHGALARSGESLSQSSVASSPLIPARVARNSRAKVAKHRMSKVPRPPNAFILYRQHHHPIVKASDPGLHNNQISVIIGNRWKNESIVTKEYYKSKAENLAREHKEKYPDYQYQPRKPSEKSHRKRKVQAAKPSSPASAIHAAAHVGLDAASRSSSYSVMPSNTTAETKAQFVASAETVNPSLTQLGGFSTPVPNFNATEDGDMFFDLYRGCEPMLDAMITKHNTQPWLLTQSTNQDDFYVALEPTEPVGYDNAWEQSVVANDEGKFTANNHTDAYKRRDLSEYISNQTAPWMNTSTTPSLGVGYCNMNPNSLEFAEFQRQCNIAILNRYDALSAEFDSKPRSEWNMMNEDRNQSMATPLEPTEEDMAHIHALYGNDDFTSDPIFNSVLENTANPLAEEELNDWFNRYFEELAEFTA